MNVERTYMIVGLSVLLILMLTMSIVAVWGMATGELPVSIKWVGSVGMSILGGGFSLHKLYWYIFSWPRLDDFGRRFNEPP